jgi:hypothetical protein
MRSSLAVRASASRRERRVHDGGRSAARRTPRTLFSRNAGNPAGAATTRSGAVVSSPRRGQRWPFLSQFLSSKSLTLRKAPQGASTVCACSNRPTLGRHPRRASPRHARLQVPHLDRAARARRGARQDPLRAGAGAHSHLGRGALPAAVAARCGAALRSARRGGSRRGRLVRAARRRAWRTGGVRRQAARRAAEPSTASTSSSSARATASPTRPP